MIDARRDDGSGRTWQRDDIRVTDRATLRRSIAGTAIGNFMEWYDFGVYGYIATTIAQVFYPGNTVSAVHLIATFGTLAAAFVVRPLGGAIFGPLGDRIGRRRVLVITIAMMTVGTTATGLLPGYRTIGIWAPILLVVGRVFQGLSTGGEYAGAMTYVAEQAPDRRRGVMVSFLPLGNLTGYVLAAILVAGLQTWLSPSAMLTWGWRVPLLMSAPLGLLALYMRLRLDESSVYEKAHAPDDSGDNQFHRTIVEQWRPLLLCASLVMASQAAGYMLTGYLPTYLKVVAHVNHNAGLAMITATLIGMSASLVFLARLGDRIGVKPVMRVGCGLLITASIPAFLLLHSGGSYAAIFLGVLLIGMMELCFDSTEPRTLPALFPAGVRYGALAIAYNVSISAFGGTIPLIAQALISATGNPTVPAYILITAGVVGVVTLHFMPEVAGRRLPGEGPAVESESAARELAGPAPD